jgi:TolA-binding protein
MRRNGIVVVALVALGTVVAASTASVAQDRVVRVKIDPQLLALPQLPPPAAYPDDPADSLYRAGRRALSNNDFSRAATIFHEIVKRYPRSSYAPDALYWEAFSLYRTGGATGFRNALARLEEQKARFPRAATRGDADALSVRVRGELARLGDTRAAAAVAREAARAARAPEPPPVPAPARNVRAVRAPSAAPSPRPRPEGCPISNDEDARTGALNALLQVDSDQALSLIQQVLARRDLCSESLREKAVFLLSQKRSPEAEKLLLSVARDDPSTDVRKHATFWLFQLPTPGSLQLLEKTVVGSKDTETREAALFALSQHPSPRAGQILRSVAERSSYPRELRGKAIFWIGQRPADGNSAYLESLYGKVREKELKELVLFSLVQMPGHENVDWLLGVARSDPDPELRGKAIDWLSQSQDPRVAKVLTEMEK